MASTLSRWYFLSPTSQRLFQIPGLQGHLASPALGTVCEYLLYPVGLARFSEVICCTLKLEILFSEGWVAQFTGTSSGLELCRHNNISKGRETCRDN